MSKQKLTPEQQDLARASGLLVERAAKAETEDEHAEQKVFSSLEESCISFEISRNFSAGDLVKEVTKVENRPDVIKFFKIESITDTAVTLVELKYGEEFKHYVREPLDFVTRPNKQCKFRKVTKVQSKQVLGDQGKLVLCSAFLDFNAIGISRYTDGLRFRLRGSFFKS